VRASHGQDEETYVWADDEDILLEEKSQDEFEAGFNLEDEIHENKEIDSKTK